MKVVKMSEIEGVSFTGGTSFRSVLERDNMGFAMMKTVIPKGGPYHWCYRNHLEACYCISGKGLLTNLTTNQIYEIIPETTYILDQHDDHSFEALTDVVLISVFNPPLTGNETHDNEGNYK